jgi:hypothetical protein
MADLGEMLDRLTVSVKSADRSVTIGATLDGRMTVELAPGSLRRHTEESLARQLAGTVRVAIAALQRGFDEAVRRSDEEAA